MVALALGLLPGGTLALYSVSPALAPRTAQASRETWGMSHQAGKVCPAGAIVSLGKAGNAVLRMLNWLESEFAPLS